MADYMVDWSMKMHIRQDPPQPEGFAELSEYLCRVRDYARDVIRNCGYDPDDYDALPRPDDGVIAGDLFVGIQLLGHAHEAMRIYGGEILRLDTGQGLSLRGTGKLLEHIYHLGVYAHPHETIYDAQMRGSPPRSLTDFETHKINKLYAEGVSSMNLAERFGVSQKTIQRVLNK
jgi:hypothetical protein